MAYTKIKKLFVANRGEIALRIQRSCKKLGIVAVQAYSEIDQNALFVSQAEEKILIGPAPAKESYLSSKNLIAAALKSGCQAVHPGYGFLSENAEFAVAVEQAGLVWIGPNPKAIAVMANKTSARSAVEKLLVPCLPGTSSDLSNEQIIKQASLIGYPLIIKASAGGGGRGMRKVFDQKQLEQNLPIAREEAERFFNDSSVFLEKLLLKPRHIEVQIVADKAGNMIHLGTRECSVQRRHQKLIEEAPAPFLSPKIRDKLHQAGLAAARSVNYDSLGTVEFLLEGEQFYFLEMNTRVQVEHPVTEEVTGIDLISMQIELALGKKLTLKQKQIKFEGHAFEFRINAEDIDKNFSPCSGEIFAIIRPKKLDFREEIGFKAGDRVSMHYDGLIGKIVIRSKNRQLNIAKSLKILSRYLILGLPTSLDLDPLILENGLFQTGKFDISYIDRLIQEQTELGEVGFENSLVSFDPEHNSNLGSRKRQQELLRGLSSDLEALRLETEKLLNSNPEEQRFLLDKWHTVICLLKKAGFLIELKSELESLVKTAKYITDPLFQMPTGGAEVKNTYIYTSERYGTEYTIEVLHKNDGNFLAIPVDNMGKRACQKHCRRSNVLQTVLKSLINDVLEKKSPKEVFAQ